jgi:hypothetical protein
MYVQPSAIGDAEQSLAMLSSPPLPTSQLRVAGSSPAAPTNLSSQLTELPSPCFADRLTLPRKNKANSPLILRFSLLVGLVHSCVDRYSRSALSSQTAGENTRVCVHKSGVKWNDKAISEAPD